MTSGRFDEVGVTNLGPVPRDVTFLDATKALSPKYSINPDHQSRRLTLCETVREIWRIADRIGGPEADDIKVLAAMAFSYGKSMDARMKELKAMLDGAS